MAADADQVREKKYLKKILPYRSLFILLVPKVIIKSLTCMVSKVLEKCLDTTLIFTCCEKRLQTQAILEVSNYLKERPSQTTGRFMLS